MRVVFLFLVAFLLLFADHDKKYDRHFHKDLTHLELSDEQYQKIKKILKNFKKKVEEFREQKEKTNNATQALFAKDNFDIDKYKNESLEPEKQAIEIEAQILNEIHEVLNKEQRKKFLDYFEEWKID
ncbi:MAG: periplasmic protein CpxP/Spy [Campylobacterota bacterium]|nr:periplasmic protein CpxP/Spy [Campylobacterota bacterium]